MRLLSIIFALLCFTSVYTQESASLSKHANPQKPTNSVKHETNNATGSQKNAVSKPINASAVQNDTSNAISALKNAKPTH